MRFRRGCTSATPWAVPKSADPVAAGDTDDLLQAAWEQHDELDRDAQFGWTIVDYAPHLWREYEAVLLDYEFRLRSARRMPAAKPT